MVAPPNTTFMCLLESNCRWWCCRSRSVWITEPILEDPACTDTLQLLVMHMPIRVDLLQHAHLANDSVRPFKSLLTGVDCLLPSTQQADRFCLRTSCKAISTAYASATNPPRNLLVGEMLEPHMPSNGVPPESSVEAGLASGLSQSG